MFYIITGKPGASKTLHAIALVEKLRAEARKGRGVERPVFYWNIGDVALDGWQALGDASTFDLPGGVVADQSVVREWFKLPPDSIIVLDECQKFWCKRPNGSQVPAWVSALETHRKSGYDIVGISQDPTLIDTHVRKLCGLHTHYRRIFCTETYHSFTWQEKCVTDVEGRSEQATSLESRGKFPKQFYGKYRSAAVHNVTARPPWKWIVTLGFSVVAIPLLVYLGIQILKPKSDAVTAEQMQSALKAQKDATVNEVVTHVRAIIEANPWDARLHAQRIEGIDASQPFYDELIRPVSFPKIRGCGTVEQNGKVECFCTSQQGTRLHVPGHQCRQIVKYGWFDFTKPDVEEPERPVDAPPVFAGGDIGSASGSVASGG